MSQILVAFILSQGEILQSRKWRIVYSLTKDFDLQSKGLGGNQGW